MSEELEQTEEEVVEPVQEEQAANRRVTENGVRRAICNFPSCRPRSRLINPVETNQTIPPLGEP